MASIIPRALLSASKNVRLLSPCCSSTVRWMSSGEPLPNPPPDGTTVYSDKLHKIVDDISMLTLREVSQLNELLKTTLNIPDSAPVMAHLGMLPASTGTPQDDEAAPKEEAQTHFTVNLLKFEEGSKVKLIKEIKVLMEGMNLVQAKKFVEGVPQVVKKNIPKEEAEKLKAALEAVGGEVTVE